MSLSKKLPVRKQLRLKGYEYSSPGFYFITIDCKFMECWFGHIYKSQMVLNEFGNIALNEWHDLPLRFKNCQLHTFQIMPNHIHGILEIFDVEVREKKGVEVNVLDSKRSMEDSNNCEVFTRAGASPAHTRVSLNDCETSQEDGIEDTSQKNLSDIIGSYKSIVYNKYLALHKEKFKDAACFPVLGKIWQRGFYDRIIPDKSSLKSVSRYIKNNPKKWNRQ